MELIILIKDLRYYKNNSPSKSYVAVLINPCYYALLNYRLSHYFYKKKLPFLSKLLWLSNRIFFSMDIDYRAKIGENVMFIHGMGLTIGKNAKIGSEVKIYQGVTIGGTGKKRLTADEEVITQPIIGDRTTIYTNSCILGPIYIGENCKIAAGSIVVKDIPSNTIYIKK